MSTVAETGTYSSRRAPIALILLRFAIAVVLMAAGAFLYLWFVVHSALPQLDGRLQVAGLAAPVTVTRDNHGVPTIEAASLQDLFFAQGFVTAQDRLWQMDITRRFDAGELSEVLGKETLKIDREQRILGLRAAARKSLQMATPRDRSYFDAYARGVNAFIESHGKRLPLEFRILK